MADPFYGIDKAHLPFDAVRLEVYQIGTIIKKWDGEQWSQLADMAEVSDPEAASQAADSAKAAAGSAADAETAADSASAAETEAGDSAQAATNAAQAASGSASTATQRANAAGDSALAASGSADAAAGSAKAALDSAGQAAQSAKTAGITSGTIDGAVIGGTTPAAGTFAPLKSNALAVTGGTVDGVPVGGTAPAAGTFTTARAANYGTQGSYGWGASQAALDTFLFREQSGYTAQRNGAVGQVFRVYNTYTDANNYERVFFGFPTPGDFQFGTEQAGTGGARGFIFYTGGQRRWQITVSGVLQPCADNTVSFGTNSLRLARVYAYQGFNLASGVLTGTSYSIAASSQGRIVFNSANAVTASLYNAPEPDQSQYFSNEGAGAVTVTFRGRTGSACTCVLGQDASVKFSWNSTLTTSSSPALTGYWSVVAQSGSVTITR